MKLFEKPHQLSNNIPYFCFCNCLVHQDAVSCISDMGSRYHPGLKSGHRCLLSKDWLFWNSTILEKKCNFYFHELFFLEKFGILKKKSTPINLTKKIWEIQGKVNSFQFDEKKSGKFKKEQTQLLSI